MVCQLQIGLAPGGAYDNRLCSVLLSELHPERCCWRIADMMWTGSGRLPITEACGPTSRQNGIAKKQFAPISVSGA